MNYNEEYEKVFKKFENGELTLDQLIALHKDIERRMEESRDEKQKTRDEKQELRDKEIQAYQLENEYKEEKEKKGKLKRKVGVLATAALAVGGFTVYSTFNKGNVEESGEKTSITEPEKKEDVGENSQTKIITSSELENEKVKTAEEKKEYDDNMQGTNERENKDNTIVVGESESEYSSANQTEEQIEYQKETDELIESAIEAGDEVQEFDTGVTGVKPEVEPEDKSNTPKVEIDSDAKEVDNIQDAKSSINSEPEEITDDDLVR